MINLFKLIKYQNTNNSIPEFLIQPKYEKTFE